MTEKIENQRQQGVVSNPDCKKKEETFIYAANFKTANLKSFVVMCD